MKTSAAPLVAFLLLATLTLIAAYIGSYTATVEPFRFSLGGRKAVATYRYGGAYALDIFAPIHCIDRKLRPHVWGSPEAQ